MKAQIEAFIHLEPVPLWSSRTHFESANFCKQQSNHSRTRLESCSHRRRPKLKTAKLQVFPSPLFHNRTSFSQSALSRAVKKNKNFPLNLSGVCVDVTTDLIFVPGFVIFSPLLFLCMFFLASVKLWEIGGRWMGGGGCCSSLLKFRSSLAVMEEKVSLARRRAQLVQKW